MAVRAREIAAFNAGQMLGHLPQVIA